jgi:putative heme-binding domain-containing protein
MNPLVPSILLAKTLAALEDGNPAAGVPGPLDQQLRRADPSALARDARRLGDARRGALVFFQPALTGTQCHLGERAAAPPRLGPDLATLGKAVSDVELVESILEPSKVIQTGYEPVTIAMDDGRTVTGLLVEERPDAVVLRDAAQGGKPVTIARSGIEQRRQGGPSLMPAGLVNALTSRQQIAESGPARARALRPDPALVSPPLPDYERRLDHAGIIAELGTEHFRRGAAIYNRVCANCHGTRDQPGSLPAAPRFAAAALKNGGDPYAMYRTLTDGFGQMAAQTWMVPRQQYDVIHYIREAYLKPWLCQIRPSGFDFLPGGHRAAVCTWDGDVWLVEGIDDPARGLTWQRIAAGLFQPLGLKVLEGRISVGCRDQIVCLRDLNGDAETDFYECFNSDHQVTEHFHEFAMGLQADPQGNFFHARGARHGLAAVVPQHGTLLRVAKDGESTAILATGFRAPNGVCVNSDGTFFLSDQEGFWTPKNRINWVQPGGFYGNLWGYHDVNNQSPTTIPA